MKNCLTTALLLAIIFGISSLEAAQLYWDPNATTGSALGGTGNWDLTDAFWYDGTADNIWPNGTDDAFFTGTAGTVTLTTSLSAGNLFFTNATGNYVLTNATGGEILTFAGTIDTGGGEHTIATLISPSGTLNKNGAGRLHLPVDNSTTLFSAVMINQGDVSIENNNGAGQNTSITVADGAALVLNGGANGLPVFRPNVTINGSGITNSGALRNLSGVTTFFGQIILGENNSVIYVDSGSALAYGGASPLTDNGNNYNLIISGSGTGNVHLGETSIGGTLMVEGPASCYSYLIGVTPTAWPSTYVSPGGTFYVENNNSFGTQPASLMTTNVILDGGTINSTGSYTMYANDGITVTSNGGTLTNTSGTWKTCNIYSQANTSVTLTGSGSFQPAGAAGATTGTINLGTGALIKGGSGDCNLTFANPALEIYSNLVVNGGSISFNYDQTAGQTSNLGTLPSSLNASNIILNGGSLHAGHTTTIGATRGIYVGSGGGTIEDVVSSGGSVTINSPIIGPGSMNFPNGHAGVTSVVTLAANNTYSGTTTVGASSLVNVGAGGGTGTLGTGNTTDNGTLTFNRTGSYSYAGVISGSGWVTKVASGTITLTGANTYTGNTTNSAGTLFINNTSKSGTGTGSVVVSGGTLGGKGIITGAVTINSGATLAPGATASSVGTLTISNNLTIAGNVAVAINKSLSPSNGEVVVTGTLANTGTGKLTVTNLGAPLSIGDRFQIFSEPLTGNAMTITGVAGVTWNNNLAVDGSISVATLPVPVIKSYSLGAGKLVLSGTNGYATDGFSVLTSTNAAAPLHTWTSVTNGSFDASGNFTVTNTITNTVPAQFFIIQYH